jgi:hypothetical protein
MDKLEDTPVHLKPNKKIDLTGDHDRIVDLYLTQRLSLHATADQLGYSYATMHRYLCSKELNRKGHSTYKRHTCSRCGETFVIRWIEQVMCPSCDPAGVDAWKARAEELYAGGKTMGQIAKILFVPNALMREFLNASPLRACDGCGGKLDGDRRKLCCTCAPGPMDLHRFREYGIIRSQFDMLWQRQGGTCALCPKSLSETEKHGVNVDHDHDTGCVRGLLCITCNYVLGVIEKRPGWIAKVSLYCESDRHVQPVA